jgi:hypothetical protein
MTAAPAERVVDEIVIDGQQVKLRSEDIPLDLVKLDPRNPRIANSVKVTNDPKKLQKELEDILWRDQDVRGLYTQVLANQGLVERIIVREDHTIVEGNCRTVVYRKLREAKKDVRWQKIPARVLPDVSERQIAVLLGEMHVAGKNTWTPFEKAGHVYKMHRELGVTQDEIAQKLRMSKSKVNQLIRAFDFMKNKYLPRYPGTGSVRKFSYFEELIKKPELREWIDTEPEAIDEFVDWVGTDKLQGVNVRELPEIVANPEARRILGTQGFQAARKLAGALTRLFRDMEAMTESLRQAPLEDIQRVRRGDARAEGIVQSLREALDRFLELCESQPNRRG